MTKFFCTLLGHRRDKHRARPFADRWRSYCTRCAIALERNEAGKWKVVESGDMEPPSAPTGPLQRREPSPAAAVRIPRPAPLAPEPGAPPQSRPAPLAVDYAARSTEARRLAELASDRSVALIHREIAMRYDLLAQIRSEQAPPLKAVR